MDYCPIIKEALRKVVSEHGYLAIAQEIDFDEARNRDIHEVALAHRLAYHLENSGCFAGYIVDCEYNRHGTETKRDERGCLFRPDIVIHVRGNDDCNLIMIETKKYDVAPREEERVTTSLERRIRQYCYQYAFLVKFPEKEVTDDLVIPIRRS